MSEPRRLNTGDARHIHRADAPAPAAPAAEHGAGRSISTAQAHGAQAPAPAPAYHDYGAPGAPAAPAPAAYPAPAAPAQDAYAAPAVPADAAAPYSAPRQVQPTAYRTAPPASPYARQPQTDAYAAARYRAQAQANARARGGETYTRAAGTAGGSGSSAAGRQLSPAQRQEIALRQAQSQHRGADRYAAYTTGDIDRNDLEARLAARRQAEQAARAAQAARAVQSAQVPPAPAAPTPEDRAARMARQVQQVMQAQEQAYAAPAPAQPAPAPAPAPAPVPENSAAPAHHSSHSHSSSRSSGGSSSRRSGSAHHSGGSGGGKPPKNGHGSAKNGGSGNGKGGKRKKKLRWWQILLLTLLIIALILGGTLFFIMRALRPGGGALGLNALINTPKEFQGDELNFLMVGIDRTEPDPNNPSDENVGDGNTDMILWVHFNKNDNSMRMLQIPRDYIVSTDGSLSNNYRINNIAKTQGSGKADAYQWNMAALCEQVHDMFQIPIDGYVSIHIEDLIEMVDVFGGVSMYIPQDIEYGGSYLPAGYQTLNGAAAEFLLRNRHGAGYENSDIDRLNMQRRFYAALFRRMKEMTVYDLFRHVPAFLNWMETDLSVSDLASFAVSVLKMPSDNIMVCQMPVGTGGVMFKGQSVVYPARQADADLLNEYFRENTGPVDASQLQLVDTELESQYGIYPSQLPVTDPNVQFMGDMMRADQEAQQNNNLDGSGVEYFEDDPAAGADAGSDTGDAAADPAA